jgi:adenine phosphoribosyltransferase
MGTAVVDEVLSITTQVPQVLALDELDASRIKNKRILCVDDVISTGASLEALERLVNQAGGIIVGRAAILAEGDAANRDDIIYLEKLPLFWD